MTHPGGAPRGAEQRAARQTGSMLQTGVDLVEVVVAIEHPRSDEPQVRSPGGRGWVNAQDQSIFLLQHLPGVVQVASYHGLAPGATAADHAQQGDVVLYDWNNDGVYDHEAIITSSDGTNPDGTINWDLVDAHTNNRYHAYWTLARYNANWATTRIVVLHIPATTS